MKNLFAVAALSFVVTACGTTPSTGDLAKEADKGAAAVEKDAAAEAAAAEAKASGPPGGTWQS